jgi:hypothetical protein
MRSVICSIIFLSLPALLFPKDGFKVISSDFNSILIEYTPTYNDSLELVINNIKYKQIELVGGNSSSDGDWGTPQIPEYIFNIGVPSEFGNTIEILNAQYKVLQGKIIPKPKMVKEGNLDGFVYEISEKYYEEPSEEIVTFGDFGISRGSKIQGIKILPVKFYPVRDEIKLYTKIIFKINYLTSQILSKEPDDPFISDVVVNYEIARYWVDKRDKRFKKNITSSVLSNGTWFKFEAPEEGMYKITRGMLQSYGIDPNTVNPRTIKIYNNGGKMLPQDAGKPRPVDLVENAIWVIGEEDGKFDEGDYIVFYGRGNNFWDYDTTTKTIRRYFHLYSNSNYYFITSGGGAGKRIENKPSLNQTPGIIQTSTKAYKDWEVDKINIGRTGRVFVGDDFSQSTTSRVYMNTLNGRLDNFPVQYNWRFVNASPDTYTLKAYENSVQIFSKSLIGIQVCSTCYELAKEYIDSSTFSGSLQGDSSKLKFEIITSSATSRGYLDYFEISYRKELKAFNDLLTFYSQDTTSVIQYNLSGFTNSNIKVFDVSDYSNVRLISDYNITGGTDYTFRSSEVQGNVSKYIAVGNDNFKIPFNPVVVENSNIRGITSGARYIIITHKNFADAAQRVKSYRENEAADKISTIIINVNEIFNEFSCGILDVCGIRDFLRYAYNTWQITPEYILFLGSGNYDYKNMEGYNTNFVPTYQTENSIHEVNSYSTDDFFAKIDNGNDRKIDFAIGRITAKTLEEANDFVSKIIEYESQSPDGLWRNKITFVADDGYTSTGYEGVTHTVQSETLANSHTPKSFDLNKIYMAAYPIVLTGAGRRMPAVNKAIIDAINEGTLILNYLGHGNPELWAHEVVFDRNIAIPQIHNDKYFLLIAATCSFGYFDIPNFTAASEDLMFLNKAGCIISITATRPTFPGNNADMNNVLFDNLLKTQRDSLNLPITVGKALYLTKQIHSQSNAQKYHILGDPALRLVVPKYEARIDSINKQSVTTNVQLKALGNVSIDGSIIKPDGSLWEDFNGEGVLTVFDSERKVLLEALENYDVTVQGGLIFRGRVSIINGRFSVDFVVPKDISYENDNGKIVFYFYDGHTDGLGYTNNIVVGGTDSTAVNDGSGPEIEINFDEASEQSSYLVNPDSRLIVKLRDDTGINTTGTGVGHKMEGILNDQEISPLDFTNYFVGDPDAGGRSGEINYPFSDLEEGDYKLLVKAWDVFNNLSTEESYFTVVNGNDLVIRDVYNYPNPFTTNTIFTFQKNLSENIDLRIKIYTVAGRLIKEIEVTNVIGNFVTVGWDGRDNDGDQLANGTYLYKITIKTIDGVFSKSVLGKLAIIR